MKTRKSFEKLKDYTIKMRKRGDTFKEIDSFLVKQELDDDERKKIISEIELMEKTTYVPLKSMSFGEVSVRIRYTIIILFVIFIFYLTFFVKNIKVIPIIFIILLIIIGLKDQHSKSLKP